MLAPFSIDAYLPAFPGIEVEFAVDRAMLSQSLGVYLAAFAISTLFWGPLSDRIGRRLVILGSSILYVLASAGCALANDIDSFLVLRIMQGLAASGGLVAGRAMIRDAYSAEDAHKAMSHVMLMFAIAPAIAPLVGAWLYDVWGWHSIFWFLTSLGGLLIVLVIFVDETLSHSRRQSAHPLAVIKIYARMMLHGRFLALVFSVSFAFAGLFLYIAGAPTVIYDFLGLESHDFSVQFLPMVGGMMLGSYISSRLAHYWPTTRTITLGLVIMVVAVIVNLIQVWLFQAQILTVIGPLVLYSLGMAIIMPAVTILALDCFPENRGAAAAMQSFIQMSICAGVASVAVPLLHTQWLYFVMGQAAFLLIALLLRFNIRLK
jgi:DHA1 family bicyclomycin/chloramphenicol resistance-like MFS transporter